MLLLLFVWLFDCFACLHVSIIKWNFNFSSVTHSSSFFFFNQTQTHCQFTLIHSSVYISKTTINLYIYHVLALYVYAIYIFIVYIYVLINQSTHRTNINMEFSFVRRFFFASWFSFLFHFNVWIHTSRHYLQFE